MINLRFMCLNHGPFIYLSDSCHIYWTNRLILKAIQLTLDRQQSKNKFLFFVFLEFNIAELKREEFICVGWIHFFGSHGSFGSRKGSNFQSTKHSQQQISFSAKTQFSSQNLLNSKESSQKSGHFLSKWLNVKPLKNNARFLRKCWHG